MVKKRVRRVIGLVVALTMMFGSTMATFAAVPQATANWSVSTYPGQPYSGSSYMLDAGAGAYCPITCNGYSAADGTSISFSSSNFISGVSIGGNGEVYAQKRDPQRGNTYTVYYNCNGKRTIASGKIQG